MWNGSVRVLIDEKRTLSLQIPKLGQRIDEIEIHLDRFKQLDQIYLSDIERLSALEEAGFLMALGGKKACTLCGTPTELQTHALDLQSIERVQTAALIEITKIESQRKGLQVAIADLAKELANITLNYSLLSQRLDTVEREINRLAPQSSEIKLTLNEIIVARDRNREGLLLLEQRNDFKAKLEEYTKLQKPSKDDKPKLKTPDAIIHEFCQMVGHVLKCWEFPGNCDVSFDDKMFDLKIDGKLRINNGKGVRAVTHAAFKVALLIFCRENKLPHTGFIVLDTPLLTYRDPMKDPKAEKLSDDEKIIAQSSLKQKFFEHLSSISHFGQIIILENVDPPNNIESIAHVQTFYGAEESSRNGLFPVNHRN